MITIPFYAFSEYFEKEIKDLSNLMYANNDLMNVYTFTFYTNTGENEERKLDHEIIFLISDSGGLQDSSVSIDTYLQSISFKVIGNEVDREDIEKFLAALIAKYKSYSPNISYIDKSSNIQYSYAANISIKNYPDYSTKIDAHGKEIFTATFTANAILFSNASLSNEYKLEIDNVPVQYNNIKIQRSTELEANLEKKIDTQYFPNTTIFQIDINGLYTNIIPMDKLLNDCAKAQSFNQIYNILLYKTLDNDGNPIPIVNYDCYTKNIMFSFSYGTLLSWSASFVYSISI